MATEFGYTNESGPKLRDNLLKLQVYFNTLNIETISEYPTYKVRTRTGQLS